MERNPDINDEDIGIRTFQLRKEQMSERAVEKIRHNIKDDWPKIISEDIVLLRWILGELWALMGQYDWEHVSFSTLNFDDIKKIISIGKAITIHEIKGNEGFSQIEEILRAT